MSLLVDERKIDGRKPTKVPKGQEGESYKSLTHSCFIVYFNLLLLTKKKKKQRRDTEHGLWKLLSCSMNV